MKILNLAAAGFLYFCVATVLAQAGAVGVLWSKGQLTEERLYQILAIVHGIDESAAAGKDPELGAPSEEASYEDVIEARVLAGLDHDLRETAIDKGLGDLRNLEDAMRIERDRYSELRTEFDKMVANMESGVRSESLGKLQRILEAMQPRQAKDHLLMMLEKDDALDDVVTLVKSMPTDKRKKILSEFKDEEAARELFTILREIRLGMPELREIENTRQQLDQLN